MFLDRALGLPFARALLIGVALVGMVVEAPRNMPPLATAPRDAPRLREGTHEALRRAHLRGPFDAELVRVVDGDTFEARVRIWFGQEITTLVRLRGIDAPELAARCPDEARRAEAAREHLALLLASGALTLRDVSLDKYGGRIVAGLTITDEASGAEDAAALMLASGHARRYDGARRASWCRLDRTAAQSEPSFPSLSATR